MTPENADTIALQELEIMKASMRLRHDAGECNVNNAKKPKMYELQ